MTIRLPIYDIERDLVARLRTDRRLILSAPTGSGKSTQVPQILLQNGFLEAGQVVILQPRRLAARLLAARVAQELGVQLGQEVGYQIRFDNVTSAKTRIRFVTEGILLRQMQADPKLRGVSALIFDEFHERHLYGDITLARSLDLQEQYRPDLNLIVMSATLDADVLTRYLSQRRNPPAQQRSAPVPGAAMSDGRSISGSSKTSSLAEQPLAMDIPYNKVAPVPPHPGPVPRGEGESPTDPRHSDGSGATAVAWQKFTCSVLVSEGRTFPVTIEYAEKPAYADQRPIWEQAADAFGSYVHNGGEGDVLVFMPGGFEISQTIEAIRHTSEAKGFILLPLHGELSPKDQDAAVARYDRRKVVVATNVAETSLTIDGVRLVIDGGLARMAKYDSNRGINTLLIEKISQSSADQRAGRAGRTAPGTCMRLWSREEHGHRAPRELPEVKRLDLSEVILNLKDAGVEDLRKFRWLDAPDETALAHAEELLLDLGALGRIGGKSGEGAGPTTITAVGRKMLAFPLHPRYARMMLAAQEYGCVYQAALVAALTQGRDLLIRNVDRGTNSLREDLLGEKATSDFWILMRAWNYAVKHNYQLDACRRLGIHAVTARQVGPLLEQFLGIATREGLDTTPREVKDEALQKCILIGFSDRVARRLDQGTLRCELVHNRRGTLARESAVQKSPLLVASEVREIEGREINTILSLATAIETDWLAELFPEDMQSDLHVQFDSTSKRVQAAQLLRFRGLALEAKRVEPPPADQAAAILAEEVIAGRLPLPGWDHAVEQWLLRLRLLCEHCPDLQLPPITDDDRRQIIEQLCLGAVSYKDLKEREVKPVVMSWLSHAQRELLDKHAPERLTLANGRTPKVSYETGNSPHIALRIQELYDVHQTPKIGLGRIPVLVHILTPGMKPIQITQDLAGFWRDHYPRIKSELQRKYPRHVWR
jgi:ATP-dependent helicase HrpB